MTVSTPGAFGFECHLGHAMAAMTFRSRRATFRTPVSRLCQRSLSRNPSQQEPRETERERERAMKRSPVKKQLTRGWPVFLEYKTVRRVEGGWRPAHTCTSQPLHDQAKVALAGHVFEPSECLNHTFMGGRWTPTQGNIRNSGRMT